MLERCASKVVLDGLRLVAAVKDGNVALENEDALACTLVSLALAHSSSIANSHPNFHPHAALSSLLSLICALHPPEPGAKLTQEGQSIIESSSSLIERLMCNGQPFNFIAQRILSSPSQQLGVHGVQKRWIFIDGVCLCWVLNSWVKRRLHLLWCVRPSWSLLSSLVSHNSRSREASWGRNGRGGDAGSGWGAGSEGAQRAQRGV